MQDHDHCDDHVGVFAGIVRVETRLDSCIKAVDGLAAEQKETGKRMLTLSRIIWIAVGSGLLSAGTAAYNVAAPPVARPSHQSSVEAHYDHIDEDKRARIADARDRRSLRLRDGVSDPGADAPGDD